MPGAIGGWKHLLHYYAPLFRRWLHFTKEIPFFRLQDEEMDDQLYPVAGVCIRLEIPA